MSRYLIQTDKEVSVVERAALYLLDEPFERSDMANLSALDKNPSLCPVGSVEFVQAWIRHLGLVEPKPIDYHVLQVLDYTQYQRSQSPHNREGRLW